MEKFYISYEKTINGATFYFVKQYRVFPEYKNVPPIIETYGMHTSFRKACRIAMIEDPVIQKNMADKLGLFECFRDEPRAIILSRTSTARMYKLKLPEFSFSFIFKLLGYRQRAM